MLDNDDSDDDVWQETDSSFDDTNGDQYVVSFQSDFTDPPVSLDQSTVENSEGSTAIQKASQTVSQREVPTISNTRITHS